MGNERLDKNVIARICNHMNTDHKDAIMQYAIHYGGIKNCQNAIITNLTSTYLELEVDQEIIQIAFDHALQDSQDAHKTLISMLKAIPKKN